MRKYILIASMLVGVLVASGCAGTFNSPGLSATFMPYSKRVVVVNNTTCALQVKANARELGVLNPGDQLEHTFIFGYSGETSVVTATCYEDSDDGRGRQFVGTDSRVIWASYGGGGIETEVWQVNFVTRATSSW